MKLYGAITILIFIFKNFCYNHKALIKINKTANYASFKDYLRICSKFIILNKI